MQYVMDLPPAMWKNKGIRANEQKHQLWNIKEKVDYNPIGQYVVWVYVFFLLRNLALGWQPGANSEQSWIASWDWW